VAGEASGLARGRAAERLTREPRHRRRRLALQPGIRPDLTPAARAGLAVAKAEDVSRRVRPRLAGRNQPSHVVDHRVLDIVARHGRARRGEEALVPAGEVPRLVIGGAADHDAIDAAEVLLNVVGAADTAVGNECERREVLLERGDDVVPQRRQLAVLLRADAVQPGVPGMDDEHVAAALGNGANEIAHEGVAFDAVDADPVLDGDRDSNGVAHRTHAVGNERRLGHQAGAEGAALDALARAAAVEVDLRVAPALTEAGAGREIAGVAAAELQGHRLLDRIEIEMACDVAVQQRAGGHHLGVEARSRRQQTMEVPAVPVGPVHHRRYAQTPVTKSLSLNDFFFFVRN